jgi:hypothetical protein
VGAGAPAKNVRLLDLYLSPDYAVFGKSVPVQVESYLDTGDRTKFGDGGTTRLLPHFTTRLKPAAAMPSLSGAARDNGGGASGRA